MARPSQERCRLCSKLTATEAKLRHGPMGDSCWDDQRCYNRQSYYRHRGVRNYNRRKKRQQQKQPTAGESVGTSVITIGILAPAIPAVVVHWYRATKQSPLHAIGAELWMGNDRVAKIEPVHCLGLTEMQVKTLLLRILDEFSQHCGQKLERFREAVELHPLNCPIRPCPLHPEQHL